MAKYLRQVIIDNEGTNGIGVEGSIYGLGIQGTPGTEISINNNTNNPLILNATGVFNINIENDMPPITSVAVSQHNKPAGLVYIDVIYEGENESGLTTIPNPKEGENNL